MSSRSRKPAVRAFATEVEDASHQYKESDEERAPNLALLPTGAEANRVFVCGTLTEYEDVGSDSEYYHARVVDPTGTFHVYAGQYEPDATALIRDATPPEFVAMTAKVSRYELDEGGYNVTLRPESMSVVDRAVTHRWQAETAEATLDRLAAMQDTDLEDTVSPQGRARERYDVVVDDYRQAVRDALNTAL